MLYKSRKKYHILCYSNLFGW